MITVLATFMVVIDDDQVGLLGFHTYLLLTNTTSWEFLSSHKIDYINCYPYGYQPFDRGIRQNIKDVFFHGNELKRWELPDLKQTWESRPTT